jgi:pre-mRNA-processing factor 17
MDDYTFAMQQRTFEMQGYALNPSTAGEYKPIVGSLAKAHANGYQLVDNIKANKASKKEAKRKRAGKGDASVTEGDDEYMGPWAKYQVEQEKMEAYEHAEEDAEEWRQEKKRREEAKEKAQDALKASREERTIFHGECDVYL